MLLRAQAVLRVAEATSALSEQLAAAGVRASTRMDPLAPVSGEDLRDQIAALQGTFWRGQPLAPLGAPEASAPSAPAAGGNAGGGAPPHTRGCERAGQGM